jgi:hypothetical protein
MVGDSLFGFNQTFGVFRLGIWQSAISLYVAAADHRSILSRRCCMKDSDTPEWVETGPN